jgi:hypothetical protein
VVPKIYAKILKNLEFRIRDSGFEKKGKRKKIKVI